MKKVGLKRDNVMGLSLVILLAISILCLYSFQPFEPRDKMVMSSETGIAVPIIMYHSILKDTSKAGKFVISPTTLENDLLYLKENGYETVMIKDLIAYAREGAPLPAHPVVLTFDDGYLNNVTYALPLLEKYEQCAVISVVGEFCDIFSATQDHSPNYSHLTWDEIKDLAKSGYVEIGNHTYFMHHNGNGPRKGATKKPGESEGDYTKALTEDLLALQRALTEKSEVTPITFTYPYGFINAEAKEIIKKIGFEASLSCNERINIITRDPACLYGLGRFNRPSGISTEAFMKRVLKTSD